MTLHIYALENRGGATARLLAEATKVNTKVHIDREFDADEGDTIFQLGTSWFAGGVGATLINTSAAITLCSHKVAFRKKMQELGAPIPRTWYTWNGENFPLPVIVRPHKHFGGQYVIFCKTRDRVKKHALRYLEEHGGYYISEYIPKVKEYRVFVGDGKVVAVAEKIVDDPKQIAWNVNKGGRFENVRWNDWPVNVCVAAIVATLGCKLDFGGVDVMLDAEGKVYILEINTGLGVESDYRISCIAKFLDWVAEHGLGKNQPPPHVKGADGEWRKLVHPSQLKRA